MLAVPQNLAPELSVCIGHRNRAFRKNGEPGFRRCYPTILDSLKAVGVTCEIVIAEWSDDVSRCIGVWVYDLARSAGIDVRVIYPSGEWTMGGAKKRAAAAARGKVLAFIDADMIVVPEVFRRGLEVARQGRGFFPGYMFEHRYHPELPLVEGKGFGNAIVGRREFELCYGFLEGPYAAGEDAWFARWWHERGLAVREDVPGFLHIWHDPT